MTMSMYSSYTPEDFNNIEEDIFGEYGKYNRFSNVSNIMIYSLPDRLGVSLTLHCNTSNVVYHKLSHN